MGRHGTIIDSALEAARRGEQSEARYAELLKELLRFCAFEDRDKTLRPNPFDDPYVGAMLTNEKFDLLGAHRKETGQERHAEPNAILNALKIVSENSGEAKQVLENIEEIYRRKSWLSGDVQVEAFESHFSKAGILIKKHFNCEELYLFSTLEPCKDYETQPSCACIICAAGIDRVFYASDDTNAKGKGRDILESGSDARGRVVTANPPNVLPNLAVDEAVWTNRLFFTAHDIISRMFGSLSISATGATPSYSTFRLDYDYVRPEIIKSRLQLLPVANSTIPIYQSPIRQFGISNDRIESEVRNDVKLNRVSQGYRDDNLVLLSRSEAESDLIDILFGRISHNLGLPGTLIFTCEPNLTERFQVTIDELGVKSYINAFRKHDEHFKAKQHMALSVVRSELNKSLYIVVKCHSKEAGSGEPYATFFGEVDESKTFLESLDRAASRITLFATSTNSQAVCSLLDRLSETGQFKKSGKLAVASLEIRLCRIGERAHDDTGSAQVENIVQRQRLINRVKVFNEPVQAMLSADHIDRMVRKTGVDPTFLSPQFLAELTGSLNWRDRKSSGAMLAGVVSREPPMMDAFVLGEVDSILGDDIQGGSWAQLCTYLNAVQDVSGHAAHSKRETVLPVLERVGAAIEREHGKETVAPWLIDVTWRWLACWTKYAKDYDVLAGALFREAIWSSISKSPFLASQLAYYTVSSEAGNEGVQKLLTLLEAAPISLAQPAADATAVMCARLAFALGGPSKPEVVEGFQKILHASSGTALAIFDDELERCKLAWTGRLSAVEAATGEEIGRTFATLANLRTLIPALKRRSDNDAPTDSVGHVQTWRGDQTRTVYDALRELGPKKIQAAIEGLVTDKDVSTRWAGLSCTLGDESYVLINAIAPSASRAELHKLREVRRRLARAAMKEERHYWLEREILAAYANLVQRRASSIGQPTKYTPDVAMPALSSLGLDRTILKSNDGLHPEIVREKLRYASQSLKIALVLPPIHKPDERPEERDGVLNEGSPPLGLGQIASYLSAHGHYVKVIDAHRFSFQHEALIEKLAQFDVVGFGLVISTMESTRTIINDLRPRGTKIVLGGHAPTLLGPAGIDNAGLYFDYLVTGAGEAPFLAIAQSILSPSPDSPDVHPQVVLGEMLVKLREQGLASLNKPSARAEHSKAYVEFWKSAPWLERHLFDGPKEGVPYEPALTRDGQHTEAHVVTSRGCNWGCTFCTEALIGGTHGEARRDAEDVVAEINWLTEHHGVNRVQFVDDNVFPSRPRFEGGKFGQAGEWALALIDGLTAIRLAGDDQTKLHWRGLMRIEDLIEYQANIDGFNERLASSGCNLLAFGIETGNDQVRQKIKGGVKGRVTNEKISAIVSELNAKGIYTKGYFMLGGPGQDALDCVDTIDFACSSGVDLAYFAIYKDFRGLVRDSGNHSKAPKFGLFSSRIDETLLGSYSEVDWEETFGDVDGLNVDEIQQEYASLKKLGFSFRKFIKYNDFHLDEAHYSEMGFQGHPDYLRLLSRAYLRFYCRPGWSNTYRELLSSGY